VMVLCLWGGLFVRRESAGTLPSRYITTGGWVTVVMGT